MLLRNSLLALLLVMPALSLAQIYKTVDEDGNVTYTDQPPQGAQEVELRDTNRLGPPPTINYPKPAPEPEKTSYEVRIDTPEDEAIIPLGPGNFSVSASVSPRPEGGTQLQLMDNGDPYGSPQSSSSWALTNMHRGTHELEVALLDSKGKELARSNRVTVHVFRPGG